MSRSDERGRNPWPHAWQDRGSAMRGEKGERGRGGMEAGGDAMMLVLR